MKAYLYSPNSKANIADQWDFGLLNEMLEGFNIFYNLDSLPKDERAVVVIPARHNADYYQEINKNLAKIDRVVLFLMGDEEGDYPVEKVSHPNIEIWVQNPHPGRHDAYHKLGTGYPQHMRENLPFPVDKSVDVYFSGQITHRRRHEMWDNLIEYELHNKNVNINRTKGFTQGVEPKQYYKDMQSAKVAPCPSGAVVPDSFRLFEALECMTVPLAEETNPTGTITEYWDWLFGEAVPFPKIQAADRWVGAIHETLEDWPNNMHHITCWYIKYKRDLKAKIKEQYDVSL